MATLRVVTVKSSGGSYSSLNAALVGEVADLVSLDRALRIDCYPQTDSTAASDGAGWTTDATRNTTINAIGQHAGFFTTSIYNIIPPSGAVLTLSQPYAVVSGILVEVRSANSGIIASDHCRIERVIARAAGAGGVSGTAFTGTSGKTHVFVNCIAHGFTSGTGFSFVDGNHYAYNCTSANNSFCFRSGTLKNCLAQSPLGGDFDSLGTYGAASRNNVSKSTFVPGTNGRTSKTATFRSAGSDYRLAASDTAARGFGTSLYDDPVYAFTTDVDGSFRKGTWDVGADQYIAPTGWTLSDLAPIPVAETFASPATEFSQRSDNAPLSLLLEEELSSTIFTDSVAESVTVTASQSAVAVFAGSLADSATLVDAETVRADFAVTLAESGAASEDQSATADFVVAQTEAETASDSQSATADFVVAYADSTTPSDSATGTADLVTELAETLTATDAVASALVLPATVAESVTATDSQDASVTFAGSVAESTPVTDSLAGAADFVASNADTLASVDTVAATADFVVARAESLTVADAVTEQPPLPAIAALAPGEQGAWFDSSAATATTVTDRLNGYVLTADGTGSTSIVPNAANGQPAIRLLGDAWYAGAAAALGVAPSEYSFLVLARANGDVDPALEGIDFIAGAIGSADGSATSIAASFLDPGDGDAVQPTVYTFDGVDEGYAAPQRVPIVVGELVLIEVIQSNLAELPRFYVNGVETVPESEFDYVLPIRAIVAERMAIGGNPDGSRPFSDGDVFVEAALPVALSVADRQVVYDWITDVYGLELPTIFEGTVFEDTVAESLSVTDTSDATVATAPTGGGGGIVVRPTKRPGFQITVTPPPAVSEWVVPPVRVVLGPQRVVPEPAHAQWVVPDPTTALGDLVTVPPPAISGWVALAPDVLTAPDPDEAVLLLMLADGTL